jgi:hypothetical protein
MTFMNGKHGLPLESNNTTDLENTVELSTKYSNKMMNG